VPGCGSSAMIIHDVGDEWVFYLFADNYFMVICLIYVNDFDHTIHILHTSTSCIAIAYTKKTSCFRVFLLKFQLQKKQIQKRLHVSEKSRLKAKPTKTSYKTGYTCEVT
jgi:hypothetical protein